MKEQKHSTSTPTPERFNNLNDSNFSNKEDLIGQTPTKAGEVDGYEAYMNRPDKKWEKDAYAQYLNRPDKKWEREAYKQYQNRPDKVWEREAYEAYRNRPDKVWEREVYEQYKKNKAISSGSDKKSATSKRQEIRNDESTTLKPTQETSFLKEAATPDPVPALTDDPSIVHLLNDPIVGEQIQYLKGPGEELSIELQSSMGFEGMSGVKVHTDEIAILLCEVLNARAFAYGKDIFFNEGEFDPASEKGLRLLAHELLHIDQQADSGNEKVQRQVKDQTSGAIKAKNPGKRVGKAIMMILSRKAYVEEMSLLKWQKALGGSFNDGMMTLDNKVDERLANKADKNAKAGVNQYIKLQFKE